MSKRKKWVQLSPSQLRTSDPQGLLDIFATRKSPKSPRSTDEATSVVSAFAIGVGDIEVPDLSGFPTAHKKAEHLLQLAAGIEHALLAQYLYSAYSIHGGGDVGAARETLVGIAVEEMSHLMTVQNLLLLIGTKPTVRRSDRQDITTDPIVPFDLLFEKLSKTALAKYIVAESPGNAAQVEPLYPFIENLAGTTHANMIKKVGLLYALLGVVFGNEAVLKERAEALQAGAWDQTVRALADTIAVDPKAGSAYGGRTGMHLADSDFQSGSVNPFLMRQGTDLAWDRSERDTEFRVFAPRDRLNALNALRDISLQGEGPSSTASSEKSHFVRFVAAFKSLYGDTGTGAEPTTGVGDVPTGATIIVQNSDGDASTISHPDARLRARLAELRYWILLGSLDQYLNSAPDDRDFLVAWCITEMYHLKLLGKFLAGHKRTIGGTGAAAIPFNLPVKLPSEVTVDSLLVTGNRTPWPQLLQTWFHEAVVLVDQLTPTVTNPEERQVLRYMQEVDRRKILESTMRQSGSTSRTTFDLVREILEWGAGAGHPYQQHAGQGRFWNLPLAELKSATINGAPFIGTASNSQLLNVLGPNGGMPANRNPLSEEYRNKIKVWIADDCPANRPVDAPIQAITEIRLLPSLALARMGSSTQPMQSYTLDVVEGQSYRQIHPAETLIVNEQDSTIAGVVTPADVRFKDSVGRVKPVCPFLEVWGVFDDTGELRPLTNRELGILGLDASSLKWTVRVANLKAYRRTGQAGDRIEAAVVDFSDHSRHELLGRADNLRMSRSMTLGSVRYIRPTGEFPEIRLRFTPATGKVFGHRVDANINADRNVYDPTNGTWDSYNDGAPDPTSPAPRARLSTAPGGIYATTNPPQRRNLGYLDDSCDGIVSVTLTANGRTLTAHARIASGPPDFAPDSLPVRTVADDLEQVLHGPDVTDVTADEVIEIVRRALETVRAIGLPEQNQSFPFWERAAQGAFGTALDYSTTVGVHQQLLTSLASLKAPANSPERVAAHQALTRIAGAVRAWDEAANYGNPGTTQSPGMRQMPALMRGADGDLLALTRRQRAKLLFAVERFRPSAPSGDTPRDAMVLMIGALQFGAFFHGSITTAAGPPLSSVFADSDQVLTHIETGVVQGISGPAAPFLGQKLIVRGDPGASPFLLIVSNPAHRMNRELTGTNGYRDANSNKDGLQVIREWIASLT